MLVSVIIPCYNVEAYVSECIDSVILQTFSEVEIICVDNNSTDSTLDVLKNYKEKYPDKIFILSEHKPGASCARNKGLSIAKGGWIQFLDADDLLLPEKINHQIEIISKNRNAAFVAATSIKLALDGMKTVTNVAYSDLYKALYTTKLGNTCANMFNFEKLKMVGGWNESLKSSQESDLMFRLLKNDFQVVEDTLPLTIIRERESGQISQRNLKENLVQYIELRLEIIKYLKESKPTYFEKEKDFYYQYVFSQIRALFKYDIDRAVIIYNQNFEKGFIPKSNNGVSFYSFLFKFFGFKNAERLRRIKGN